MNFYERIHLWDEEIQNRAELDTRLLSLGPIDNMGMQCRCIMSHDPKTEVRAEYPKELLLL